MKKAKISELKAGLCSYLAQVKAGNTLIVCERATPIARLVPFEEGRDSLLVREASRPIRDLNKIRPVHLRNRVDAMRVLSESRREK